MASYDLQFVDPTLLPNTKNTSHWPHSFSKHICTSVTLRSTAAGGEESEMWGAFVRPNPSRFFTVHGEPERGPESGMPVGRAIKWIWFNWQPFPVPPSTAA